MVALVNTAYICGRLGVPSGDTKLDAAIQSAIDASVPLLEAKLDTVFSKRSAVDLFYIPLNWYPTYKGYFVLKLSAGLVRPSPALSVLYGDSLQLIATALDLTECILKEELGHLYVPDSYRGSYLQVSYDSGLDTSGQTPDTPPDWLKEAAAQHTIALMSAQQIGDPKPELSEVFKYMMTASTTILDAHIRSRSYAISPL